VAFAFYENAFQMCKLPEVIYTERKSASSWSDRAIGSGRAASLGQREVLGLHSELGQRFFHRNTFAGAEEVLCLLEAATVLVADWFPFIKHDFEQGADGTKCGWRNFVQQGVGLLQFLLAVEGHSNLFVSLLRVNLC